MPPGTSFLPGGFNNKDPLADVRVREAMNIAIDRDAINESLHYDTALPMTLAIQTPGGNTSLPYDPRKAMELLAEAAADGVFHLTRRRVSLPS
jgi:peptide/nickel transport system substrate-binding protein